ncbi:MAG: type IIA DNA topoisomerase subunit B [Candidatus Pacebacteria bacterium]|nr:type IIA DNA topoisomerase subunit B [Candidatus Paceibacterota bacterium]
MADKNTKKQGKENYSASDISVLEGLEPVRKRPGMYIGSTGPDGLHHLIREIFDNSRDEAMAGYCDHIEIALLPDNIIRIVDNGRGIPIDKHPKTKKSALEVIMTVLHAGGKFDNESYKFSGGLHGVGASVVNALSTYTRAEVHKDGNKYFQEYAIGKPKKDVKKFGKTTDQGTIITFKPDDTIFSEVIFDWKRIVKHYQQQAYLVKNLRVSLLDMREYKGDIDLENSYYLEDLNIQTPSQSFYFEGGIVSMVRYFNANQKPVHKNIFHIEKETDDGIHVEVALQYVDDITPRIVPFANNISTPGGGMHVTGFKTALTRLLNAYNKKNKVLTEKDGSLTGDDVLEGISAVISVKMKEIQFEGQTKDKLGSPEARAAVEKTFGEAFSYFLEENPNDAKDILRKAALALKARKAAKAAKDTILRKGALEGFTLPGKLTDCQTKNADEAEIFIVEGDSAGGTAKQGRDRRTQAILPLRGKPLNVERVRLDRMLGNNEIKSMVIAFGTSIGETFNIEKARYKKIIIATDADVDGAHIRILLMTFLFRYFREFIDNGYIYVAQPPLYKIKKGKSLHYAYSDRERDGILKELGVDSSVDENGEVKKSGSVHIQRYKGLGEMNAEELWETSMNPETRTLKQVTVDDAVEADRLFETLMGKDVAPRKAFIQNNALLAEIDI